MVYEKFDFNHERFVRRKECIRDFFSLNYHKNLSEEEFVSTMKEFYKDDHGKSARTKRCPSNLRREYRHLNAKYGFFLETE